jgi:hypothetical protein
MNKHLSQELAQFSLVLTGYCITLPNFSFVKNLTDVSAVPHFAYCLLILPQKFLSLCVVQTYFRISFSLNLALLFRILVDQYPLSGKHSSILQIA